MDTYTLSVKIAEGGTKVITQDKDGNDTEGSSFAGHMWYSLSDGNEKSSYGFASDEDKAKPFGKGERTKDDDKSYQDTYYTVDMQLTKEEYDKLKEFGENPRNNGFTGNYNALTNSCVDFTWKALEHANLNNDKYEGKIIPTSNAAKVDEKIYKQMFESEDGWKETWNNIHKDSKHIVYGNENDNTLTGGDKNEVFYTRKGNDTVFGNKGDDTYVYKKGDGSLTLQDNGLDENDRLIIQGFNADDAVFTENKEDLIITFNNEKDSINIKDYQGSGKIEKFRFDDKELDIDGIKEQLIRQNPEEQLDKEETLKENIWQQNIVVEPEENRELTLRELVEADLGRSITDKEIGESKKELNDFRKEYEQEGLKEQNVKEDDNVVMHMQR